MVYIKNWCNKYNTLIPYSRLDYKHTGTGGREAFDG